MVGLDREFARELLWAGYPTDQRGAAASSRMSLRVTPGGDPPDPERVKDIAPVHTWRGWLGARAPRTPRKQRRSFC